MKKNDIALLIVIIAVVTTLTFFLLKVFLGDQAAKPVDVEVATPISTEVVSPSAEVFNDQSINPTVPISIEGGNQVPIGN